MGKRQQPLSALDTNQWTVELERRELRGRAFMLGNKRAFSLSLPATPGNSDVLLHPHKWFGAYHYGHKYLEAQVLRVPDRMGRILGGRYQSGFTLGLTSARRQYSLGDDSLTEEYFVPDGVDGFACRLEGSLPVSVEPELDMRYANFLNRSCDGYEASLESDVVLVRSALPSGRYDDATESFIADPEDDGSFLYAAMAAIGDDTWAELLPEARHARRKLFSRDVQRQRLVQRARLDAADHAPLWQQSTSYVYAPVRFHLPVGGVVLYGFGESEEQAGSQLAALRGSLTAFQAQKTDAARDMMARAPFSTGVATVDRAYAQVLTRLMDSLVARNVSAGGTALDRPSTTILAGNQYFHDSWKRDENIALGFLLTLGFYDLARDVIRDTWQLQDEATGRLPQRIRAGEDPPYHSSDGTLWALIRLYQYWRCTGDASLLYDKLPMAEHFFRRSLDRLVDGMLPSGRTTHPEYLWETWMDTPHTPRDGFPVELQILWLATLRHFRPIVRERDPELEARMATAEAAAWAALERFNVGGLLADSLDEGGAPREGFTPNPYFAFGIGLDLGARLERTMLLAGRSQLAGSHGIRTLAPADWARVFPSEFLADAHNIRGKRMRSVGKFNYHRGVEWNWLARFFVEAELKYGDPDMAFHRYLRRQVRSVLVRDGIGGISELHDLSGARGPEYQAWSMAGFLEALHAFAGVTVDVPSASITIEPQLPREWPGIEVRKWYGAVPFDVSYSAEAGSMRLEVRFPWGSVPDARLDLALVLPARTGVQDLDVCLGDAALVAPWRTVRIAGSARQRVHVTVPAHERVLLTVAVRKHETRLGQTA